MTMIGDYRSNVGNRWGGIRPLPWHVPCGFASPLRPNSVKIIKNGVPRMRDVIILRIFAMPIGRAGHCLIRTA